MFQHSDGFNDKRHKLLTEVSLKGFCESCGVKASNTPYAKLSRRTPTGLTLCKREAMYYKKWGILTPVQYPGNHKCQNPDVGSHRTGDNWVGARS